MNTLINILLTCVLIGSAFAEDQERVAPDRAIQGVWSVLATSTDAGVTLEMEEDPSFARLTATKLTLGGRVHTISRVVRTKNDNGNLAEMLVFSDSDICLAVNDNGKNNGMFVAQFFRPGDNGKLVERLRVVFTVRQ
jgi:hypothetical protein